VVALGGPVKRLPQPFPLIIRPHPGQYVIGAAARTLLSVPNRIGRWQLRTWRAEVIRRVAHPGRGFTQGLISDDGMVCESTGRYGVSALCRYPLGADQAVQRAEVPAEFFAEGICRVGDVIWQLTWRERTALKWDAATLELIGRVTYNREGWGMCAAGDYVVTSDGSSELVRRDPQTLGAQAVLHVRCAGARVQGLNDLAWSAGAVWANVAGTYYLAGIDPDSGQVTDVVNARAARERHVGDPQAIMNGIAALPAEGEFLLTGKGWRSIRHVRLKLAREKAALERVLGGQAR
jgi:glutaminyl-peptide cyclotransferase